MESFECKTDTVDCKSMEHSQNTLTAQLNRWGEEGWELVSSLTHPALGNSLHSLVGLTHRVTRIFKRLNQSVGRGGAGKTSLMKTLYHIMAPDAGTAHSGRANHGLQLIFRRKSNDKRTQPCLRTNE